MAALTAWAAPGALSQSTSQRPVMVTIDGESGPCSVEFMVKDGTGAPMHGARVTVRVDRGIFSFGKLELEASTNVEGRVRFIGMPKKADTPLHFEASKGELFGTAFFNPQDKCQARHSILMGKRPPPAADEEEDE